MLIIVAVEDALSESVAKRLIREYVPGSEVTRVFGLGGISSVKSKISALNQMSRYDGPVLALADSDDPGKCPLVLVRELSGELTISPNMLIRIAVPEIESWIMANRNGIAQWLGIALNTVPRSPETLIDPKRTMVQLASRSRKRALRQGIAPNHVLGTHRTGAEYNILLDEFVTQHWNPDAARANAPSLSRAIARIAQLPASAP